MTDYDKNIVAPLLRRKAHLEEVGADVAKLAELDHALRMAGYPVDEKSSLVGNEDVEQDKPGVPRAEKEQTILDDDKTEREARKVAPKERSAKPGQETTAVPDHNKGNREVKTAEVLDKAEAKQAEKDEAKDSSKSARKEKAEKAEGDSGPKADDKPAANPVPKTSDPKERDASKQEDKPVKPEAKPADSKQKPLEHKPGDKPEDNKEVKHVIVDKDKEAK